MAMYDCFHKNIKHKKNGYNIDNNQKCFLSSKSVYYYDLWRSCDTEDWSNDAENTQKYIYLIMYSHIKKLF